MKKFLLSLVMTLFVVTAVKAETVAFYATSGYGSVDDEVQLTGTVADQTFKSQYANIKFVKVNNSSSNVNGSLVRWYQNDKIVITPVEGMVITNVTLEASAASYAKTINDDSGKELGSYSSTTWTFSDENGVEELTMVASAQIRFKYLVVTVKEDDKPIVYPTECEDPIFSFNGKGLLPQEVEVDGYAGNMVSVACPTPKSEIVWSLSINGATEENLEDVEYLIPEDAAVGDIYEFKAQAKVDGENGVISSNEVTLKVNIIKAPLFVTFDFTKNVEGVEFSNGVVKASFDKAGGSTAPQWYSTGTAMRQYAGNTLTLTVPKGYVITNVDFTTHTSNSTFLEGTTCSFGTLSDLSWSAGDEEQNTLVIVNGGTKTTSGHTRIQTITVYIKEVPIAPSAPTLLDSDDFTIENNMLNAEDGVKINFNAVDGIDIYYKLGSNVEQVQTKACTDEHEGYTKHDGNDITLSTIHSALTYFACDPATGLHSEPQTLNLSIGTGVAEIEIENGEAEYFNLQGARVANPENGLYIRVVNGKAQKVIVK